MRKIFLLLFLYFFSIFHTFAYEKPEIISRSQWGANETWTYENSPEWQAIFKKWKEAEKKPKRPPTAWENFIAAKKREANRTITTQYADYIKTIGKITEEGSNTLAWPIVYSEKIRAITIHHTEQNYKDTITGLKSIHRFHSLSRGWGDIGYNFIIGYDGKIYEGRKGGETSVGAHAKYNNAQNIGISIMGSYQNKSISSKQEASLKKLVKYLVEKYQIDLTKKQPFFKKCFTRECKNALRINYQYPIIGHRDASITDCPGDVLYARIQKLRTKLMIEQINLKSLEKKYFPVFEKYPMEKLKIINIKIKGYLKKHDNKKIEKIGKVLERYLKK